MRIDSFRGTYDFLSNFYPAGIRYDGIPYLNNEAAFQAQKVSEKKRMRPLTNGASPQGTYRSDFSLLPPGKAKALGRKVRLRHDWEEKKVGIMYMVVRAKFMQNTALLKRLLDTGDALLVEGNAWGDRTWGMVDGNGQNLLGRILMQVRHDLGGMPHTGGERMVNPYVGAPHGTLE